MGPVRNGKMFCKFTQMLIKLPCSFRHVIRRSGEPGHISSPVTLHQCSLLLLDDNQKINSTSLHFKLSNGHSILHDIESADVLLRRGIVASSLAIICCRIQIASALGNVLCHNRVSDEFLKKAAGSGGISDCKQILSWRSCVTVVAHAVPENCIVSLPQPVSSSRAEGTWHLFLILAVQELSRWNSVQNWLHCLLTSPNADMDDLQLFGTGGKLMYRFMPLLEYNFMRFNDFQVPTAMGLLALLKLAGRVKYAWGRQSIVVSTRLPTWDRKLHASTTLEEEGRWLCRGCQYNT